MAKSKSVRKSGAAEKTITKDILHFHHCEIQRATQKCTYCGARILSERVDDRKNDSWIGGYYRSGTGGLSPLYFHLDCAVQYRAWLVHEYITKMKGKEEWQRPAFFQELLCKVENAKVVSPKVSKVEKREKAWRDSGARFLLEHATDALQCELCEKSAALQEIVVRRPVQVKRKHSFRNFHLACAVRTVNFDWDYLRGTVNDSPKIDLDSIKTLLKARKGDPRTLTKRLDSFIGNSPSPKGATLPASVDVLGLRKTRPALRNCIWDFYFDKKLGKSQQKKLLPLLEGMQFEFKFERILTVYNGDPQYRYLPEDERSFVLSAREFRDKFASKLQQINDVVPLRLADFGRQCDWVSKEDEARAAAKLPLLYFPYEGRAKKTYPYTYLGHGTPSQKLDSSKGGLDVFFWFDRNVTPKKMAALERVVGNDAQLYGDDGQRRVVLASMNSFPSILALNRQVDYVAAHMHAIVPIGFIVKGPSKKSKSDAYSAWTRKSLDQIPEVVLPQLVRFYKSKRYEPDVFGSYAAWSLMALYKHYAPLMPDKQLSKFLAAAAPAYQLALTMEPSDKTNGAMSELEKLVRKYR
jgi:hypothetical protein